MGSRWTTRQKLPIALSAERATCKRMKKIFLLTTPNKKPDRQVEAVKHELKKYIGRERRKSLPAGIDFWDFDCKFGHEASSAIDIHVAEINKKIDEVVLAKAASFYIEVMAKPGRRLKRANGQGQGTAELLADASDEADGESGSGF